MNSSSSTRRKFLKAAGGIAVGLPFLESLAPRRASAAAGESRFVVVFTPNGTDNFMEFMPQGTGANFTLGRETAPVLPFKSKLLALSGVNMASAEGGGGDQHGVGMGNMLTAKAFANTINVNDSEGAIGFADSISIDQEIANGIGAGSPFKSLEFGVQTTVRMGSHPFSRMSYSGPQLPVSPEDSPLAAYNRLFGGIPSTPGMPGMLDENLKRRHSVIDYVIKEFERVNATVSADDKVRLDQHLSMLRNVEVRLQASATGGPVSCDQAAAYMPISDYNLHENFPAVGKQQSDLLVLALSCGLTRVASLQYSYARSEELLGWISTADCGGCGGPITEIHHTLSHLQGGEAKAGALMSTINRWYAEQVAYLLGRMDAVNEGGATLLDNSLAYWCSEVSYAATHQFDNIRAFLFGTAGGKVRSWQHLAFNGDPHNRLYVTLLNAMGVPATTFGDPAFSSGGALPGILV